MRGFRGSSMENTAKALGRVRDFVRRTTQLAGNSTVPAGAPASLQYTANEPPPVQVGLGLNMHHCRFHDLNGFDLAGYFTSKYPDIIIKFDFHNINNMSFTTNNEHEKHM